MGVRVPTSSSPRPVARPPPLDTPRPTDGRAAPNSESIETNSHDPCADITAGPAFPHRLCTKRVNFIDAKTVARHTLHRKSQPPLPRGNRQPPRGIHSQSVVCHRQPIRRTSMNERDDSWRARATPHASHASSHDQLVAKGSGGWERGMGATSPAHPNRSV